MSDKRIKFSTMLRRKRAQRGWSQRVLAKKSGISAVTISFYEVDRQEPKLSYAVALSMALGFSLDEVR